MRRLVALGYVTDLDIFYSLFNVDLLLSKISETLIKSVY